MSQLRKSASFRSRIPVRKNRIALRRCCSPIVFFEELEHIKRPRRCGPHKIKTNRSFAFESGPHRSRSHHNFYNQRYRAYYSHCRRLSSSSYSSSDESCESEAPHQKFARQSKKVTAENSMYISTDAISLDGLLDSVSCGSFSSPPSPIQYQNSNKDNYSCHAGQAKQEQQITTSSKFGSPLRQIMASEAKQQQSSSTTTPTTIKTPDLLVGETFKDEASKKSFYIEKQKQLSDWYYIKTKKDVSITNEAHEDKPSKESGAQRASSKNNEKFFSEKFSARDAATNDALFTEHNYVNCARQAQASEAELPNQAEYASLTRKAALGSARYADASSLTTQLSSAQRQQPFKWKNFDVPQKKANCDNQFENNNVSDDTDYIEAEYNGAVDAINNNEQKSSISTTCSLKPTCPPYYCPPTYSTHQNYPNPTTALANSTEHAGLSSVNVRLLKQHYQQQNAQSKPSNDNANINFRRRGESTRRNKNKIELQLEHWEKIGNNNSTIDVVASKCQRTTTGSTINQHRIGVALHDAAREGFAIAAPHQQYQKLPQQQINCSNCCINNPHSPIINASSRSNNMRTGTSLDNINKQCNKRSNILYQQQYKHEKQSLPDTTAPDTLAAHQQHPANASVSIESSAKPLQKQQLETKQQESNQELCLAAQPAAAPRRQAHPPTATPRAALRSRQIQKRSDETSCSSFEQLNIVGIPTGDDVTQKMDAHALFVGVDDMCDMQIYNCSQHHHPKPDDNSNSYSENCALLRAGEQSKTKTHFLRLVKDEEQIHNPLRSENYQPPQEDRIQLPNAPYTGNKPSSDTAKRFQQQQIQLQLQQNPETRQLFGVIDAEMFPTKITPSCRSDCELSGSYASLECPSPPGPPVSLPESRKDPQARLGTYLRTFYTDLSLKEPIIPQWAIPVAPGALCAARLEPELRLNSNSHGLSDTLTVDQILISLQAKEGSFLEAPRRCLIECPAWVSRTNLCLRILHAWAKEPPWPTKGTPVALALFIPLSEVKRSFANFVEKELLAKGPLNPFNNGIGGFSAAWNSLEALGPKLLFILDGYDSQKLGNPAISGGTPKKNKSNSSVGGSGSKHQYPTDVHDLLDGKLFPEARVIITTSTTNCPELLPIIQRHITYEGLTWGRSASLLGGGQWGGPSRLLDAIQESVYLRKIVRTPLGCLAITSIYETTGGDLPTDELDVIESILNCVAPETSAINVSELGRLALFCLKMKRPCFTLAEMRMYCSTPDSPLLGCLDKNLLFGKSAKKRSEYVYYPICPGMMELLAANYIASLASRPGLLAAEITGMAVSDELDPDLLKVLKFAMTLLSDKAHILLSRLTPLWLTPHIVFTLALAGGHGEDNLAALCDILGISKHPPISPLETKPLWVQVRSVPTDLMGWGMALKSPTCTLKNLELIYQLEKQNLLESRKAIEIFLDSIIANESVSTLRLSSLIEMDVKDSEISYLGNCVSKILVKPRLENFELVLTLLEEDPPILKLQSIVAALCRTIPRQPKLSFLLMDMALNTSQLVQLCAALEKCPNVTRLSLPHLRCERGAITALASLLNSRPISFLSLPSCWGARDDPPSSSGVSMGSGSGSSTGTSGLIKQGSLPGVPSPRSYAPGTFSSLPRGVFVPQSSLGRSATLPRQPLEQSLDKRSCDSVVSKTWYPTPACDGGPHNSGTLHDLLLAARETNSKLHGLDLSKAQLSLEDSMCLGETVRLSNTLHTLKLEGSSRLSEVLPSVLGASESSCLQMLSIGSPRLSLEDSAIAMCARALTSCSTLRLLSLDGWSFRIENSSTLSILRAFLSLTSIRELSMANCRLQIGLIKSETKISHAFESRSVVVLKLAGAQVTLADTSIMRGPQLLQYIGGFPCLRELDLSAPARSGMGSSHTSPLILDDKCIVNFFQNLHSHFGLLNTLKICHWVIHFDELSKTLKTISKCVRNSPISHLKMDGISVLDRPKKQRSEVNFIHCFISSLPQIRWMGISLAGKKEDQITALGNAVLDLKGYEIDIKLSESTIEHAKLMAQAISLDGKFDIKVSTFGTSSGILVHAEKSGAKSLSRKTKE